MACKGSEAHATAGGLPEQDGLTPAQGAMDLGPMPDEQQYPDGLDRNAADMSQPPGEEANGDFGGSGSMMATGGTPGLQSPSKSAARDAGHSQAATPGRFGAEQDLSAR